MDEIKEMLDPQAMDIMEKGDIDEIEPEVVKDNRTTNKGRRNRLRNEAVKKQKEIEDIKYHPNGRYVDEKGIIHHPKKSLKKDLKNESNGKERTKNRTIDIEDDE